MEFFYTEKYDEEIVLRNEHSSITKKELKQYIFKNIAVMTRKKDNVIIAANDILTFAINFFSAVFTLKNIYLVDDINKIKESDANFDLLDSFINEKDNFLGSFPKVSEEKICVNFFTSGSSGRSKCIKKNLASLIKEGFLVNETLKINGNDLILTSSASCSHLFGLTFGFMFPLCNHIPMYTESVNYPDLYNVDNSIFVSTPAFLDMVRKNNIKLNQAKYIISSGSRLKKETFEYLEKFTNVIEIYGSTETGAIAFRRNSKDEYMSLLKDVGVLPLEDSSIVRTPYDNFKPIEIKDKIEVFGNEILLKNRTDRLLKIQDKRVSAEGLESYLNDNPMLYDSYCFKLQDKVACMGALSEAGIEFLLKNSVAELSKNLKKHLKSKSEIVPQRWRFIDYIPLTERGKTDKEFIERMFNINISFPIILDRKVSENNVTLKMYFHKNCDFYSGHFPNFPITPGVAQLYFASFWGEYFFREKLVDGQIKRIKFNNIIQAGEIVTLNLVKKDNGVCFEYQNDDKIFSSGAFSCENIFEGVSQ